MERKEQYRNLYTRLKVDNKDEVEPAIPGALGSKRQFYSALKRRFPDDSIKKANAEHILQGVEAYSRFRFPRWKFLRRQIAAGAKVNEIWQMDLGFLNDVSRANPKILLLVVDSVSRYCWIRAIKNKQASTTAEALESIFEEAKVSPKIIFSDRGSEFIGKQMIDLLAKYNVMPFYASGSSASKAASAERHLLWFKQIAYKYLATGEKSLYPVLSKIQLIMNRTPRRVLLNNWTSEEVQQDPIVKGADVMEFMRKQREKEQQKAGYPKPFSFHLGDVVRIQDRVNPTLLGKKAHRSVMSKELFVITKRFASLPHTYMVNDQQSRPLLERVYSPEIGRVSRAYE